jgi:Cu-processing system ATP-binding protein
MLEVENIRKRFGHIDALRGVSFAVQPGTITGILGPNGCGKTTLIKVILGLVLPDGGSVRLNGTEVLQEFRYRENIGYMPQNAHFPHNLTINELLTMLEEIRGVEAKKRQELVELFELSMHLKKPFDHLSGGTRQKVAAVAAMMFAPPLLVLDEPTVGLDPLAVARLKERIVQQKKDGGTVILVSHMVSEIEQLVEQMVFLLDGQVRFFGTLKAARQQTGVEHLEQAIVSLITKA